MDKSGRGLF